jgi:hypothetical protein
VREFDPRLLVCELPAGFGVVFVPVSLPCGYLLDEDFLVWNTAVQTLR